MTEGVTRIRRYRIGTGLIRGTGAAKTRTLVATTTCGERIRWPGPLAPPVVATHPDELHHALHKAYPGTRWIPEGPGDRGGTRP